MPIQCDPKLDSELRRIIEARHHDPFAVLGAHRCGTGIRVRAFVPDARAVTLEGANAPMQRIPATDLFEWEGAGNRLPGHYRISWLDSGGTAHRCCDPYSFGPQLAQAELDRFLHGSQRHAGRLLGAHQRVVDGIAGTLFATWAPNAERVSVIGDFNAWDGSWRPMRVRGASGVWELFVPGVEPGALYKYELRNRRDGRILVKTDPYGTRQELRPRTASIVSASSCYAWTDAAWLEQRKSWLNAPMSIYELHLGSWRRRADGGFLNYAEIAGKLVPYVKAAGFTHVELLPIMEHPLDASWGYQTTGYFAPTSRFGTPDEFRAFVDAFHHAGIGVLLDRTPGHFPDDAHGLGLFDGSACYEHADPRRGRHPDWGTLIFNYGRNEVRSFLISSALYWLEEFHADGLRVDAVSSMLYLDYSRKPGEWLPNVEGGNKNLGAISFLQELNAVTQTDCPGSVIIAEESSAWPQVTRPTQVGGLGFSMKWNMGWMHDTLDYMHLDPIYRRYHHDHLTFGVLYAFNENFVLPVSHDEVVYGKGSLLSKMQGDDWQKFASLRLLLTFMYTYPGKKLLFMGCEFGARNEWDFQTELNWNQAGASSHGAITRLVTDLNRLYGHEPALHQGDFDRSGFKWIDCHDAEHSVVSYLRMAGDEACVAVFNFTPVPRHDYRIGVPDAGDYHEVLNSDSAFYGGSNVGNCGALQADAQPWLEWSRSVSLTLPPLGALVLKRGTVDD